MNSAFNILLCLSIFAIFVSLQFGILKSWQKIWRLVALLPVLIFIFTMAAGIRKLYEDVYAYSTLSFAIVIDFCTFIGLSSGLAVITLLFLRLSKYVVSLATGSLTGVVGMILIAASTIILIAELAFFYAGPRICVDFPPFDIPILPDGSLQCEDPSVTNAFFFFCIRCWPRWASGGYGVAYGYHNSDRHSLPDNVCLTARGSAVVINDKIINKGESYHENKTLRSIRLWFLPVNKIYLTHEGIFTNATIENWTSRYTKDCTNHSEAILRVKSGLTGSSKDMEGFSDIGFVGNSRHAEKQLLSDAEIERAVSENGRRLPINVLAITGDYFETWKFSWRGVVLFLTGFAMITYGRFCKRKHNSS